MSEYVLIKRGAYYREGAKGYTDSLAEAGLFDRAEACKRLEKVSGVTMKHVDSLLGEIDYERKLLHAKLAALDAAERNVLGLRVNAGQD